MSPGTLAVVGALSGAGAVARFSLDAAVADRAGREFPFGTLVVNVLGSLLLGVLVGLTAGPDVLRFAGTGLLGGFTTFSTWMYETHRLAEDRAGRAGVANVLLSLALGVGAAWLGRELGGWA